MGQHLQQPQSWRVPSSRRSAGVPPGLCRVWGAGEGVLGLVFLLLGSGTGGSSSRQAPLEPNGVGKLPDPRLVFGSMCGDRCASPVSDPDGGGVEGSGSPAGGPGTAASGVKIGPGVVREAGIEWEPPAPTRDPVPTCCRGGGSSFLSLKRGARRRQGARRRAAVAPCSGSPPGGTGNFVTPPDGRGGAISHRGGGGHGGLSAPGAEPGDVWRWKAAKLFQSRGQAQAHGDAAAAEPRFPEPAPSAPAPRPWQVACFSSGSREHLVP